MKPSNLFLAALAAVAVLVSAPAAAQYAGQSCIRKTESPTPATPTHFSFKMNGTFRIMQLTDLHCTLDYRSDHIFPMLSQLIQFEQPDLIVITGDAVYSANDEVLWRRLGDFLASQHIPYAVTLGNHDAERISRGRVYDIIRTLPLCVNAQFNPSGERQGDFVIPLYAYDDPAKVEARLYVMDSNDYNADDHSYRGFTAEQVAWYRSQSEEAERRDGRQSNALLFCHVPLHEFREAYDTHPVAGFRLEGECPARDNTGMFDELLRRGEVTGVFAGHEHTNNYVAQLKGIGMAYGRYSGGFGEYQELLSGARIIELKAGGRGFTTWERLANNSVVRRVTLPEQER